MATSAAQDLLKDQRSDLARAELDSILESEFFRGSQRCAGLLRYSAEHVLDGCKAEDLKERVIGFELFHRGTSYDPAQDNVVRNAANDVRKRLAQYYNKFGRDRNPILELPPGSYAVTFQWREEHEPVKLARDAEPPEPVQDHAADLAKDAPSQPSVEELVSDPQETNAAPAHRRSSSWRKVLLWAVPVVILLAAGLAFRTITSSPGSIDKVWAPVLSAGKPVLVCVAEPDAWLPVSDFSADTKGPFIHMTDAFVGVGDTYALAQIGKLLDKRGVNWRLLMANDTPPQDLRAGPAVLIGAFSNRWSSQVNEGGRFAFDSSNRSIIDRSKPGVIWKPADRTADWKASDDYALVSGFVSSETGEPAITLAGIANYGTEGAADFITNPDYLKQALKQAPHDWRGRNFQFVLHMKILGNTPAPPTIVASYFW